MEIEKNTNKTIEKTPKKNVNRGIWKTFFNLCLKANLPILGIVVFAIISMVSSKIYLLVPSKTGELFAGNVSAQLVTMIIVYSILTSTLGQITSFVEQVVNAKIDRNFRNVLWKKTLQLPMSFFDKIPANSMISRITSDTENLRTFIMKVVVSELIGLYTIYITLKQISLYNRALVYIMLGLIPVVVILAIVLGRITLRIQIRVRDEISNLTRFLSELIMSVPVIKSFNKENYESQRGNNAIEGLYKANRLQLYLNLAKNPIGTIVEIGKQVTLIFVGIQFINKGILNAATWYAFYQFATRILNDVNAKQGVWEQIKATQGSLFRVAKVLEEPEEGFLPYKTEVVETGDIVFENVTFAYEDNSILENVSFTIPYNKTTAIVGPSGVGKTTALKLIERFYAPSKGRITKGEVDIQEFNLKNWRSQVSYVTQDIPMMSGTIKENILYGVKREVTDEELKQAAEVANAHEFIMKQPEGYDTQVGQFGSRLSGGQRQRITIARALLSKPSILILDEPTSNLDAEATAEVMKGINNLKINRTAIVVAHDEQAILDADHIVVFNLDGSISSGTHMELLATNSFYRSMMGGEISA
ncbi:ABC transporter ATP-binding protein [Clostridium omnivorum]|uniref:Multidrug ABC transporter permease n=1 Tax=Clostridium omnivorum TaxID=1604902 RepID=A0ABQ5N2R3_9CLOT|nr:ABC transporter ATP-binding protein [Clostridium sp. E14]GLC29451.1 multidrug ABC transporter permease [Clostridium sp. E14]